MMICSSSHRLHWACLFVCSVILKYFPFAQMRGVIRVTSCGPPRWCEDPLKPESKRYMKTKLFGKSRKVCGIGGMAENENLPSQRNSRNWSDWDEYGKSNIWLGVWVEPCCHKADHQCLRVLSFSWTKRPLQSPGKSRLTRTCRWNIVCFLLTSFCGLAHPTQLLSLSGRALSTSTFALCGWIHWSAIRRLLLKSQHAVVEGVVEGGNNTAPCPPKSRDKCLIWLPFRTFFRLG